MSSTKVSSKLDLLSPYFLYHTYIQPLHKNQNRNSSLHYSTQHRKKVLMDRTRTSNYPVKNTTSSKDQGSNKSDFIKIASLKSKDPSKIRTSHNLLNKDYTFF